MVRGGIADGSRGDPGSRQMDGQSSGSATAEENRRATGGSNVGAKLSTIVKAE